MGGRQEALLLQPPIPVLPERLLRFGATWAGAPGWRDDPDLAASGVVVADPEMPLTALLTRDERFVLVHEDPVAKVFVARRAVRP